MIKIKAQAWSMDIILAVVIFIVAFFAIYNIVGNKAQSNVHDLNQEAERISKEATSENSSLSMVNEDVLNETKILSLLGNYSEIKEKIRVDNEFCIYFEDEEGNLIIFNSSSYQNISGIGSSEINISDIICR